VTPIFEFDVISRGNHGRLGSQSLYPPDAPVRRLNLALPRHAASVSSETSY
jgi:hypothetical protein